jgi:hypothetical protein
VPLPLPRHGAGKPVHLLGVQAVDRTLRESHFRGERSSQRELPTEMVPR